MRRPSAIFIALVVSVFFGAFFFWPILQILRGGFLDTGGTFTFAYIGEVFANPLYREGLANAFVIGVGATLAALCLALPLAVVADRYTFPGKRLLSAAVLLPIILPPFVGAIGLRQILGQYGALNALLSTLGVLGPGESIDWLGEARLAGIIAVTALGLYPILYLNVLAALSNIDPSLEEAAENLGAGTWKRFFRVTLPLMRPGLFAGGTIVFIWSFTELGVPLIFDYNRVTAVQVFYGLTEIGGNPFPYALVTVMLFFSVIFYVLGKGLLGRGNFAMMARAAPARQEKKPGAVGQALCVALFVVVILLALLPHLGVIGIAFSEDWYRSIFPSELTLRNFEQALAQDITLISIRNSLVYATGATLLNFAMGVAIAWVVVRSQVPGRQFLDAAAMLPLAVPGLVLAFGYLAMAQEGRFFAFLNPVENPVALLIIAYAVRRLPFVVRSAVAGFEQTSVTYEEAAQNLGAPPATVMRRISLPLIAASLVAGGLLAFSKSMLEVSDSLILAQKSEFYPVTKAIYELTQFLGDGRLLASALGVWAMAFLAVTILGASLLLGKKLGALFRL